jgi:hypothetical protein
MRVWLWDAGNWLGVTDDEDRAKLAAQARLRDGGTASVELAIAALGFRELSAMYIRTGTGWTAHATAGATGLDDLDQHVLAAYTPPDAMAQDGVRHVQERASYYGRRS